MNIFESILLESVEQTPFKTNPSMSFLVQIKGWYGVIRIEEMKLVHAISREVILG